MSKHVEITLHNGMIALVDAEDAPSISRFRWTAQKIGKYWYAVRRDGRKIIYMHRYILPGHSRIDHWDCNGLNNTRANLRPSNASLNGANTGLSRANNSGYKGVSWDKAHNCWFCKITVNRKQIFLGNFSDPREAAMAYDRAAIAAWGYHAKPNLLKAEISDEN